jgi:hypothetical protein
MLKNVTLSAEGLLIKKAREKAVKENTTLNVLFRTWLNRYLKNNETDLEYEIFMNSSEYIEVGEVGYNEK